MKFSAITGRIVASKQVVGRCRLAAFAAMVLVDSNKEVVGATGHISTRPVPQ